MVPLLQLLHLFLEILSLTLYFLPSTSNSSLPASLAFLSSCANSLPSFGSSSSSFFASSTDSWLFPFSFSCRHPHHHHFWCTISIHILLISIIILSGMGFLPSSTFSSSSCIFGSSRDHHNRTLLQVFPLQPEPLETPAILILSSSSIVSPVSCLLHLLDVPYHRLAYLVH